MPTRPNTIPVSDLRHERKIFRLLARGEREIAAAKGYDLDEVLAKAERLLADA